MFSLDRENKTICALSTPAGTGGIHVIRVSGKDSASIARVLFSSLPLHLESHRAYFGIIRSFSDQTDIDEVLITYFAKGKSYTGEETIEISCHGNPLLSNKIIKNLVLAGALPAERGEFTYRAFMNGKIDLTQAEAVVSLIHSRSERAAKVSLRQLQGELSSTIEALENKLIFVLANIEASIDFTTEDIEVFNYKELTKNLSDISQAVETLIQSYNKGRVLREGVRIALVGPPNVGKSSLLNALLKEDRAIVTEIPGTTRDVVLGQMMLSGYSVELFDTAGIRETNDLVESMGIQKSQKILAEADLVFLLLDASSFLESDYGPEILNTLKGKQYLPIFNKCDLLKGANFKSAEAFLQNIQASNVSSELGLPSRAIVISCKTDQGISELRGAIEKYVVQAAGDDSAVITQARHFELLKKALGSLKKAQDLSTQEASWEFLALELQEALRSTHEILGKEFDDQVMDRVFQEFCIGK